MIKRRLSKVILAVVLLLASTAFYYKPPPVVSAAACHTANLYFEARGESKDGMQAVAAVVLNRKNSGKYSSSDCMVIFQKHQFSWTKQQQFKDIEKALNGDTSDLNNKDRQAYLQARLIAQNSVMERLKVLPDGVLYYHAKYSKPQWAKGMKLVKVIGQHKFYALG